MGLESLVRIHVCNFVFDNCHLGRNRWNHHWSCDCHEIPSSLTFVTLFWAMFQCSGRIYSWNRIHCSCFHSILSCHGWILFHASTCLRWRNSSQRLGLVSLLRNGLRYHQSNPSYHPSSIRMYMLWGRCSLIVGMYILTPFIVFVFSLFRNVGISFDFDIDWVFLFCIVLGANISPR